MVRRLLHPSRLGAALLLGSCVAALAAALSLAAGLIAPVAAVLSLVPLVLVVGAGVALPWSGVFARPLLGVVSSERVLALTFDDGPDPVWTPRVLDLLDAAGQRATFFVVGARAAKHPDVVADIARRGHEVANHSFSHAYTLLFSSPNRIAAELGRASDVLERATGERPTWFRPPVGLLSPRMAPGVEKAGLKLVSWTETARDGVASTSVERALGRLERALVPGAILVLHDAAIQEGRGPIAPVVLERLLERMARDGLRSVTLSELTETRRAA